MRTLLLSDQVQAGYGGKERMTLSSALKGGLVYLMFKEDFESRGLTALATIYCIQIISKRIKKWIHKIKI